MNLSARHLILCTLIAAAVGVSACGDSGDETVKGPRFSEPTKIDNPWLPLTSTPRVELRGVSDGVKVRSVRTLLDRTKTFEVGGQKVEAVIIEDRAFHDGRLHEVALDYYAQSDDGTVYYLGEDVDIYDKAGKRIVSHEGAFLYGRDTSTLGVAMPANPTPGKRFTFERVPGLGTERNYVVDRSEPVTVPYGKFDALRIGARLQPDDERETKWYGRGIGLLKETGPGTSTGLVSVERAA